jgi:hypothetical protein
MSSDMYGQGETQPLGNAWLFGVGIERSQGFRAEEASDPPRLKALLAPYPAEEMVAWPVSPRVGNVKNNDPSLIEPLAAAG